jgi:tRNA dimethylallyltransferase
VTAPDRRLTLLTGCTGSGKTEAALRWAEASGAEIVSCDALLFYRGMDVGTAKPAPEERARVPHHLIDILEVTETMDVARYVRLARSAVDAIAGRGRPVLVVGGSGFYLKSFLAPVADDVEVPPEVRATVSGLLASGGLPALVAALKGLNPSGLGALDAANPRRVARALERCLASGRTIESLAADFAARPSAFADWSVEVVRLERPADELERRIQARTAAMIRNGLVDEVRSLLKAGLERNPSASKAIGYRETISHLSGRLPASELLPEILRNTRALVKKQRTWFRTQLPEHRVAGPGEISPSG